MCLLVKLVLELCMFYLRENSAGVKSWEKKVSAVVVEAARKNCQREGEGG
jgi:hypothetical protein